MRSIGIDPGDQAVKVVELDGSYKRTRLLRVHVAPCGAPAPDGGTRSDVVAAAAREAVDQGMRGDVHLGHPCREAVLRTIELPFKGHEAIRKVVKSEIEGEIQSQSVDDMVVDFHEIGAGVNGGTRVLVASVPKPALRAQLAALTASAIEPERIELDTMALWRVAHWAGAFVVPAEGPDAGKSNDGKRTTAVVDIGARSVKVLLVEGEQLIEMRALRLGDGVVADEIARKHGLDAATAREAAHRALTTGSDQRLEVGATTAAAAAAGGHAEGEPADGEFLIEDEGHPTPHPAAAGEVAAAGAKRAVLVRHTEVEASHTAYLQRLARELTRFLAASGRAGQVDALWVSGGASSTPGTHEMLAAVFGIEARDLDVLAHLQHDLPPEAAKELSPRLTTAIGLALARLGGPVGFQLRQEDLVLTRGFERIKFPLAIACMLGLLALFVHWNKRQIELNNLEYRLGRTYVDKKNPKAQKQFYGELNSVLASGWFEKPAQFTLQLQKGKDYTFKELLDDLDKEPVHRRLSVVRDKLRAVVDQKQKESGIYEDVSLESGLAVLVRWSEMMKATEQQLGRFLVTRVELGMKTGQRRLEFTVALRGEDFRSRRDVLRRAIDAEMQKPDSPFEPPEKAGEMRREKEELFRDPNGGGPDANTIGAYFVVSMPIKESFPPFGAGGGGR